MCYRACVRGQCLKEDRMKKSISLATVVALLASVSAFAGSTETAAPTAAPKAPITVENAAAPTANVDTTAKAMPVTKAPAKKGGQKKKK